MADSPRSPRAGSLDETQALFFRAITWPTGVEDFLAESDAATRRRFERTFVGTSAMSGRERVDVYANAYFYRQLSALSEMFPRLAYLTGEAAWNNLVTDYVLACPSQSPDLRRLGDRLPAFVAAHEVADETPLLMAVAWLELAQNRALDGPDGERASSADLAGVPPRRWPSLVLELSRPTRLLTSEWDLEAVARFCDQKRRDEALALEKTDRHFVLSGRRGHAVYFRSLPTEEGLALSTLEQGVAFSGVCDVVSQIGSGFDASDMVRFLQRWLADGVLGSVR